MKTFFKNPIIKNLIIFSLILGLACQNIALAEPPVTAPHPAAGSQIFIPETYGRIEHPDTSKQIEKNVILIKDAHCNYEAQTNISHILDILIRDYKIDLVCVEGASGHVDPSFAASYCEDSELRKKVTDKYLRTGLLTASEALSINRGAEPGFTIWGVENLRLYLKDYQALRKTIETNGETNHFVKSLSRIVSELKKKLYPEKLQKFDTEINRYEINEIPLTNFIKFVTLIKPLPSREYPTLELVLESIRLEEKIYFGEVENERSALIKHLEKYLPKEDLRKLIKQSLLFKLGKTASATYYSYLEELFSMYRQTITFQAENLEKYFELVKLQTRIDEKKLFGELEDFQESIYTDLLPDEIALQLHELDKDVKILTKVLKLESSREDFIYYKNNRHKFTPEKLTSFIKIQAPRNKISLPPELEDPLFLQKVKTALLPSEEFYNLALGRDHSLVENLIKIMEKNEKDQAVLIVGGFHTKGIKKILFEMGISTTVITPCITKPQEDSQELYLARMMDDRIDPEMILAKLSLEELAALLAYSQTSLNTPAIRLDTDATEALRKAGLGIKIFEEYTPEKLRDELFPHLQIIYPNASPRIAKIIERLVDEHNKLDPENTITLPERPEAPAEESLPETGVWEFNLKRDKSKPNRFRPIDEIISDLEKYNVYWQVLDPNAQDLVKQRIQNLTNLPRFLQKKLPTTARIRSINVKGSYIWGPGIIEGIENYHPKDIDITVIVSGYETSGPKISLSNKEIAKLFPDKNWTADDLDIRVIGMGNFNPGNSIEGSLELNRAMSARFTGVTISGDTFFTEHPPLSMMLEKIRDLASAVRQEDAKAQIRFESKWLSSSINILLADYATLETLEESEENKDSARRSIEEELSKVESYLLAKIRALKRLLEINVWFSYIVNTYPEFRVLITSMLEEEDSNFRLENVKNIYNELLNKGVNAKVLITDMGRETIELAILEAEENLTEAISEMIERQEPPAHMEAIQVPTDHEKYRKDLTKKEVAKLKKAVKETRRQIIDEKSKAHKDWTEEAGVDKKAIIDNNLTTALGISGEEFLAILSEALARAKDYPGADINNLSPELIVALLPHGTAPASNHLPDGFIGLHPYAIEKYEEIKKDFDAVTARKFIQWLLEHELVHELCPNELQTEAKIGEFEKGLIERDAQRFVELFGRNVDAILSLLKPTDKFSDLVEYYDYKYTATTSFDVGNRKQFEEDLVKATQKGKDTVQVASLNAQNFRGEFNDKGKEWGIGHLLGDLALGIIGPMLQKFLNDELKGTGTTATVYNEGPAYYILFQNVTDKFPVENILEKIIIEDLTFRETVIAKIKERLKEVRPEDYERLDKEGKLEKFTVENFNIYCGISERIEPRRRRLETAKTIADTLDQQAKEIAKYAQISMLDFIEKDRYKKTLAQASILERQGRHDEVDALFGKLMADARVVSRSNIVLYSKNIEEFYIVVSKAFILNREYTSFHTPMAISYNPDETFEKLFEAYRAALEEEDFERVRTIKQQISRKTTTYKSKNIKGVPIYLGNQSFKNTINYMIRNKPKVDLRLTFRVGGDEYGANIWDSKSGEPIYLRIDGNNIGATTFQWGVEIGDKVIDEQLRIIQETIQRADSITRENVSKVLEDISKNMLDFFDNMGERSLPLSKLSKENINLLKNKLGIRYSEFVDEKKQVLFKIPDVLVRFPVNKEQLEEIEKVQPDIEIEEDKKTKQTYVKFYSRPIVSIGAVSGDIKLIPENELDRDYSRIQGRPDQMADEAKEALKINQAKNKGKIDISLTYKIALPMFHEYIDSAHPEKGIREQTDEKRAKEIRSFKKIILSRAQEEMAASIVASEVARVVAGEIEDIVLKSGIEGVEDEEILEAMEKPERVNFIDLITEAWKKGKKIRPEQLFALAIKIDKPLDKLLGEEELMKGTEILESILKKIVEEIPVKEEVKVKSAMEILREGLKDLGLTPDEINNILELIKLGFYVREFEPLLDITEIDAGYPVFINQIAKILGVKRDTVTEAFSETYFTEQVKLLAKEAYRESDERYQKILAGIDEKELELSKEAEKLLLRKIKKDRYERVKAIAKKNREFFEGAEKEEVPDSEFSKTTARFRLYDKLKDKTEADLKDYKSDIPEELPIPFLQGIGIIRAKKPIKPITKHITKHAPITWISREQAAGTDLNKLIKDPTVAKSLALSDILKEENSTFLSMEAEQFILDIFINPETGGIDIENAPGLQSFINQLKQTKIDFTLGLRTSTEKDEKYTYKGVTYSQKGLMDIVLEQNKELKDYLVIQEKTDDMLKLRNDIAEEYNIDQKNVVIVTREDFKPYPGMDNDIKNNNLKIFGIQEGSAFHATLLFGLFYGLTEDVIEDDKLSDIVLEALRRLGVDEENINKIREEGLFFTIKLIRIADTLKDMQINKIFVQVAA